MAQDMNDWVDLSATPQPSAPSSGHAASISDWQDMGFPATPTAAPVTPVAASSLPPPDPGIQLPGAAPPEPMAHLSAAPSVPMASVSAVSALPQIPPSPQGAGSATPALLSPDGAAPAGGSGRAPAPQAQIAPANPDSFVQNPTWRNLGNAAIGAAQDVGNSVLQWPQDITAMTYAKLPTGGIFGPPNADGRSIYGASKPIFTSSIPQTFNNLLTLGMPFMGVDGENPRLGLSDEPFIDPHAPPPVPRLPPPDGAGAMPEPPPATASGPAAPDISQFLPGGPDTIMRSTPQPQAPAMPESAPPVSSVPSKPNRTDLADMLASEETADQLASAPAPRAPTDWQDMPPTGAPSALPANTGVMTAEPFQIPPLALTPTKPPNPLMVQVKQLSADGLLNVINTSNNRRMVNAATAEYQLRFPDHADGDLKANEIAQAAQQVDTNPTEGQKEAGNYQKGHVSVNGLDISIENPQGSTRSGTDQAGNPWSVTMPSHYGYVKKTEGADGDHMDVYIANGPPRKFVYVVDQIDPQTGAFDEHKALLNYPSPDAAVQAYQGAFSDGSGAMRMGGMTSMPIDDFKTWLKDGDTTKPLLYHPPGIQQPTQHLNKINENASSYARVSEVGLTENEKTSKTNTLEADVKDSLPVAPIAAYKPPQKPQTASKQRKDTEISREKLEELGKSLAEPPQKKVKPPKTVVKQPQKPVEQPKLDLEPQASSAPALASNVKVNLEDPTKMTPQALHKAQRKIDKEFAAQAKLPSSEQLDDEQFAALEDYARRLEAEIDKRGHENPFGKSPLDNEVRFSRRAAEPEKQPVFFSALTRAIEALPQSKASAESWRGIVNNLSAKGIKKEEMEWSGIGDWLAQQRGPLAKEKIVDYLRAHEVQVQEVVKGDGDGSLSDQEKQELSQLRAIHFDARTPVQRDKLHALESKFGEKSIPKYASYQTPGGQNYRELLLTLPEKLSPDRGPKGWGDTGGGTHDSVNFRGGHFDEPNILAHVRFNDRTGADGEKILHLEELQSDMHQKGRKHGYAEKTFEQAHQEYKNYLEELTQKYRPQNPANNHAKLIDQLISPEEKEELDALNERANQVGRQVPNAPFKTTWPELAFKRMVRYASEHGYDRLTWTTGAQQNERYDLSKQVERISVIRYSDDTYRLNAIPNGNATEVVLANEIPPEKIQDYVGKELAQKIVDAKQKQNAVVIYWGADLKVGGEGMRGFYDKILPTIANKLGKKFGAQVTDTKLDTTTGLNHGFDYRGPILNYSQTVEKFHELMASRHPVAVAQQMKDVAKVMQDGVSFKKAMEQQGSISLAEAIGGQMIEISKSETVHSLPITEAMHDSVLQGQPLFHRSPSRPALKTEIPERILPRKVAVGLLATKPKMVTPVQQKLIDAVHAEIRQLAPGASPQAFAKLEADIDAAKPVVIDGAYFRALPNNGGVSHIIAWSLDSPNPVQTGRHEVIHYLRRTQLITKPEWGTLEKTGSERNWITKHKIDTRYDDLDADTQMEEAVADEFADWRKGLEDQYGKLPGRVQRTFQKMDLFRRRVSANMRNILGKPPTAEDIFTRIQTGEIGQRDEHGPTPALDRAKFHRRQQGGPEPPPEEGRNALGQQLEVMEKALGKLIEGTPLERFAEGYLNLFAPEKINERSLRADARLAAYKVKRKNAQDFITRGTQHWIDQWDKLSLKDQKQFFYDREKGALKDDAYNQRYQAIMDALHRREQKAMGLKSHGYLEGYFPFYFKKPDEVRQWIEQRTKKYGPDWFTKQREFEFLQEAEAAGFELATYNPEELLQFRAQASENMLQTYSLLNALARDGIARKLREDDSEPAEYGDTPPDLLTHNFRIRGPDNRIWLLSSEMAPIWKNAMESRGLWQNATFAGDAYRGWMALRNTWIPLKLGLSLFHPAHVATIHIATGLAAAAENAVKGGTVADTLKSIGMMLHMGFGLNSGPVQGINPVRGGFKMQGRGDHPYIQAVKTLPNERSAAQKQIVARFEEGGFSPIMSAHDLIQYRRNLIRAFNKKQYHRLPIGVLQGLLRSVSGPIFEHWIPALKAEAYMRLTQNKLSREPELLDDEGARAEAFRSIAKDLDRTYGEMNYDTLFWNKTVRDAFMGSFLSAGWKLAQVYYYRGFLQVPKALYSALKGSGGGRKPPALPPGSTNAGEPGSRQPLPRSAVTYNMLFSLLYGALSLVMGAIVAKSLGGEIKELKDLLYPPTKDKQADGTPIRLKLPFFNSEAVAYGYHLDQYGLLTGSVSFLWDQMLYQEMWHSINGEDHFGRPLVSDVSSLEQLADAAWDTIKPISLSSAEKASVKGSEQAKWAVILGSAIAPYYVDQTPFEHKFIGEYFRLNPSKGSVYQKDLENDYKVAVRDNDEAKQTALTDKLFATGESKKQIQNLLKEYRTPFAEYAWRKLPPEAQIRLFKDASDEEKDKYYDLLSKEAAGQIDYKPKE